ncbi:hypothetical protein Pmar_PMAR020684 [Perkinsus marinus ATCC 50983]|uniref:Uncharacterized protein n=1 Tax=Perkinsus marinus (strain ATCC 50983 / TXsc) TaxID=423536 RepID=C5L7Q5_PERM5|nr:hypothetical protein Pmar_PMAR020684 [Perkinsus marinus ATCC 50983]EER07517.1 hypothetical protein Pmar_PMAR020684 [Perkinsus marinus ATCC 50983]|eukprot:XP_002775701.1 hypothetical protein Pmar_PMAR020684 [Perkinsus marinus ATCC 50983]
MSTYSARPATASPSLRYSGLEEATQLTRISQVRTSPKWSIAGRTDSDLRGNMVPGPDLRDQLMWGEEYRVELALDGKWGANNGPGPGAYSPMEVRGSVRIGFGSGRMGAGTRKIPEPGPGHYNTAGTLGKSGKMFSMKSRHNLDCNTED